MKLGTSQALLIAGIISLLCSSSASAAGGIQVGLLTCTTVPGSRVNLLIRSTADVECLYENNGVTEQYHGETGIALGLDLSIRANEKMAFTVIAFSDDIGPGSKALGGKYVGGQISAAAGLGIGAKALIGGGAKNIGLQPLALETSTGIGVAGGLGFLYIEAK
ncbi:MAG: hypothetical protein ACI915_001703 [Gammaproteobacteria bacterium]|jgi:hypothetical protein